MTSNRSAGTHVFHYHAVCAPLGAGPVKSKYRQNCNNKGFTAMGIHQGVSLISRSQRRVLKLES